MKKFMIIAVAQSAALVMAAPAMAELVIETDGYMLVRGHSLSGSSLSVAVGNSSTIS